MARSDLPVAAPDPVDLLQQAIRFLPVRWKAYGAKRTTREEAFAALAALLAERQQDKERIKLLEVLGNQAVSTIEFLHGCLTDPHEDGTPGGFTYGYPEQTERELAELRRFLPSREICVHSKSVPGCQGYIDGKHAREVMGRARAALAVEEDAE